MDLETKVDEVADGVYRLSTWIEAAGLVFNQYLLDAEQPLLFHTGQRNLFPLVQEAMATVMPPERLRWIAFGHLESDECGAMNQWLEAAPESTVLAGHLANAVSINDLADRPPQGIGDGEVLDLGGKRVRYLATPHLPHGWDAGLMFEETTGTLLCSDLLGQIGDGPALAAGDVVGPALESEKVWRSMSISQETVPMIRRLADLEPRTLAIMHGASLDRDCPGALRAFADGIAEGRLAA
jgi:flavorubredoxin